MTVTDTLKIDMHRQTACSAIYTKQYDSGLRKLSIELFDNELPFFLEEGCAVQLRYTKPDGSQGIAPCDYAGNIVTVCLTDHITCCKGRITCDIAVYQGNTQDTAVNNCISSSIFYIQNDPSAYDENKVVSSDEYSALAQTANECKRVTDNCIHVTNRIGSRLSNIESILAELQSFLL